MPTEGHPEAGGGGPEQDSQKPKDALPFDNCEQFVNFLVNLAVAASKNTIRLFTVSTVPQVKFALGVNMMLLAYKGYDKYIRNGYDGFQSRLTNEEQKAGVYSHIIGMGGARLAGPAGMAIGVHSDLFDRVQKLLGDKQGPYEVAGNVAGIQAGALMDGFISSGSKDGSSLTNSLRSLLCK